MREGVGSAYTRRKHRQRHVENAKVSSPKMRHCIAIIGAELGTTARALA